jgi:hypothetical protein
MVTNFYKMLQLFLVLFLLFLTLRPTCENSRDVFLTFNKSCYIVHYNTPISTPNP